MAVLKAKASGFKCEKGYPWLESYWIRMKQNYYVYGTDGYER